MPLGVYYNRFANIIVKNNSRALCSAFEGFLLVADSDIQKVSNGKKVILRAVGIKG
jgi:hypothetical protein